MAYSLLAMYSHKPIAKDTTPMDWNECVCVEGRGPEGKVKGESSVYSTVIYHSPHN